MVGLSQLATQCKRSNLLADFDFWGFACIIVVRFLHPLVTEFADWILSWGGWIIPALIVVLMLIDTIKSVTSMLSFQKALAEFNEKLNAQANELKASVKERAKEFEEGLLKKQENVDMKIAEIEAKRKQDKRTCCQHAQT